MCIAPIVAAIKKCEDILGPDRIWVPNNEGQAYFLEHFYPHRNDLSVYNDKELRSWVSWVASELNLILADEGFSLRFEDFPPGNFGFLSILDVLVYWLQKGMVAHVTYEGEQFPAVRFSNDEVFSAFTSLDYPYPIGCVETKEGDRAFMTIADRSYSNFELVQKCHRLSTQPMEYFGANSLTFPMIDYDSEKSEPIDLSWLVGMHTTTTSGNLAKVEDAKQQSKYKKNEDGARFKSAVMGCVSITCVRMPDPDIIIDQPYLEWHMRPGAPFPTFQAYWTPDDWKNPGNLEL